MFDPSATGTVHAATRAPSVNDSLRARNASPLTSPPAQEEALVDARVGSPAVIVSDLDACPLPEDPLLAEMASSLRGAGTGPKSWILSGEWSTRLTSCASHRDS